MQVRCTHCHKPFALNKDAVHAALDAITAESLGHYNVHCPHCGRTNRVSRRELQRSAPDWRPTPPAVEAPPSEETDQIVNT